MNSKNGNFRTELLTNSEFLPSTNRPESIVLDQSISNAIGEANQTTKELANMIQEILVDASGEVEFNETATFIVEADSQKLILQRAFRIVKD